MPFHLGGYGGRGRGGPMKWVVAGIIALIGIVTYLNRGQINPTTGEKQYVALTVDQEKALGLNAAPQLAQQMGGAVDPARDPAARLVQEVGSKLVKSTEAFKSPYRDSFDFHLLNDSKTVNAFALPGGQIFITRALYEKMDNEAQLAGVLGHEMGHVINRHSAEHMAKGQLGQMLAAAAGVATSDSGSGGAAAAQVANQMLQLRYGRKDELESDTYGLRYMVEAGYHPREMVRVMQILKQASGGGGRAPDFLSSHPDPDARIAAIEEFLRQNEGKLPGTLSTGRQLRNSADRFQVR